MKILALLLLPLALCSCSINISSKASASPTENNTISMDCKEVNGKPWYQICSYRPQPSVYCYTVRDVNVGISISCVKF